MSGKSGLRDKKDWNLLVLDAAIEPREGVESCRTTGAGAAFSGEGLSDADDTELLYLRGDACWEAM